MACPVCRANSENFITLNESTANDTNVKIAINRRGIMLAQHVSKKNTRVHSDTYRAAFCPVCGRKFE